MAIKIVEKIRFATQSICFFLLLVLLTGACANKAGKVLRFAVIGDIHYRIPDYTTAKYLVPLVANELDTMKLPPEFIIQTGDFFHGNRGTDIAAESSFAFKNFAENFKYPFFVSKGNHDTREYFEKESLPLAKNFLDKEIEKPYYSFDKANCHFIILDCTMEDLSEQLAWLEEDLASASANKDIEHIFVAGHYPLWIVSRAGFTREEYATPVASLLARYKVDAYFCGHTHNKSASVRTIDGQPLTQIMDAAVVEEGRLFNLAPYLNHTRQKPENPYQPGILPLSEAHQVFIPPSKLRYCWGYQEGSTTTYNIVTVNGKTVQVDWHVLGRGKVRSFKWDEPGKIVDLKAPEKINGSPVKEADLDQIEQAWLYVSLWTEENSIKAPVLINNKPAGQLLLDKSTMAYSPFWNKREIAIDPSAFGEIKMVNEISIENPGKAIFGVGHVFLLLKFKDGHFAKSSISQKALASFPKTEGLKNFPAWELVEPVELGMPLAKTSLKFDRYIEN